ncbi:MAG TPA: hypothetical protein VEA16_04700 [Vicinamibacterales bacterium]|nr:hypothetical protein [Vicinamibacterales bacterium]
MLRLALAAALLATLQSSLPSGAAAFLPWGKGGPRTVNAIEFAPDGNSMIVALFVAEVAKMEGRPVPPDAPDIALYESRREDGRWSAPRLLPFAGTHKDYEGTLSPDGSTMVFNSWRPLPDGRAVTNQKNNLWMVRRESSGWSAPIYLAAINRFDTEESYAAIGPGGRMVFLSEAPADAHGPDYNLYATRIVGNRVDAAVPFGPAATAAGEGDPWYARDGSYVIFTRWDRAKKWEEDADLYITFDRNGRWTEPVRLSISDPGGPDYAVSIAGNPEVIYWKRRGGTFQAPWAPVLADARARAR